MPNYVDHIGYTIELENTPKRIISLVPSQTELLYDLGLEDEVVGITKFCIHPNHWFRSKKRIGGTKKVHIDWVADLNPDLIIANKEENVLEQVHELRNIAPVWTSEITCLSSAVRMIRDIGSITNTSEKATAIANEIESLFSQIEIPENKLNVLYLIWRDPYMVAGGDTFIHQMLGYCGCKNVVGNMNRYPCLSPLEIQKLNPDIVMLSSEPYPFKEKHLLELQELLPNARLLLVDGELFSWYGSRLLKSPSYFKELQSIFTNTNFNNI